MIVVIDDDLIGELAEAVQSYIDQYDEDVDLVNEDPELSARLTRLDEWKAEVLRKYTEVK